MPNVGGPRENNRRILISVVQSIILYGAGIWKSAIGKKIYRDKLIRLQRKTALRIVSACRTTSTKALMVIALTPPINLLVEERIRVENKKTRKEGSPCHKWQ